VGESSALADRRFIIDFPDTLDESIVKRHLPNLNALLFSLPYSATGRETNLLCKPMFKRRHRENSQIFPFHWIGVFWLRFGEPLHESENVNAHSASPKRLHY